MPYEESKEQKAARQRRYRERNLTKIQERSARWRADNPEKVQAYARKHLLKRYGMTPEEYGELHDRQQGLCAICGNVETVKIKGTLSLLRVDHDHKTGVNRELLCNFCNLRLGLLLEDPTWTEHALNYLSKHGAIE